MFRKRFCTLLLALALCLGLAVPASAEEFSDVPASYAFHQAIQDCVEKGILSGYRDGTFRPGESVTRAQFCVMLVRAFYPGEAESDAYAAWKSTGWYVPSAAVLASHGAMAYSEKYWTDPSVMSVPITRNDMARFIARVMRAGGCTVSEKVLSAAQAKIADYDSIPESFQEAVKTVFALGIITGYSGSRFEGKYYMNRGQSAVIICRMMQCMSAEPGMLSPVQETVRPAPTTLTNGKAVTEENVLEMLNALKVQYPDRTDFSAGYPLGDSSPVKNATHPYFRAKDPNGHTSSTLGCGGWAALLSDAMFGQTGFEPRKTDLANARPGDVMVQLNKDGLLVHVAMITERPQTASDGKITFAVTEASTSNDMDIYRTYWNNPYSWRADGSKYQYDVWTRYPA